MATKIDGIEDEEISKLEEGTVVSAIARLCPSNSVVIIQKVIAELIGTYFVIFSGCGAVAVNKIYGSVTFPGICVVWGLIVMVMVYSVGHVSGAHFNPAVTFTFALFRRFPFWQVSLLLTSNFFFSFFLINTSQYYKPRLRTPTFRIHV
ncbi:hypothetical protein IC582_013635 [Cucumis melo]